MNAAVRSLDAIVIILLKEAMEQAVGEVGEIIAGGGSGEKRKAGGKRETAAGANENPRVTERSPSPFTHLPIIH